MNGRHHYSSKEMLFEMERLMNTIRDIEHELVQKDIRLATLEFELALQKQVYALLRESYLKIVNLKSQGSAY